VVFDSSGEVLFQYNKLHPYKMSVREQTRYSLGDALAQVSRTEDMLPEPQVFYVAETPVGRIGVMICEDLSNAYRYLPIVHSLALDWLFVPVLDGVQTAERWTAESARVYSREGTTVVVATSLSLVEQHMLQLVAQQPISQRGVGLVVRPRQLPYVLESTGDHHDPVIHSILGS
jgi:predicted amidohydrolase